MKQWAKKVFSISLGHRRLFKNAIALLAWFLIWSAASARVKQTLLLPSPMDTLQALSVLLQKADFWASAGLSILRILAGFALGAITGSSLAAFSYRFGFLRPFFLPFVSAVKAAPIVSFIILAFVWLSPGGVPVFATALIVLPVVYSNLFTGFQMIDPLLLEMGKGFRLSWRKKIRAIYWPSILPYVRAAIASGVGMAWKAGIAAEVIATPPNALGSLLYQSKIYLDTPGLFASTLAVILLSILLEKMLLRLLYRRKEEEH